MKKSILITVALAALFTASCGFDLPVSEMAGAKSEIDHAKEARADRYAPEKLKAAEAKLFEAHDYAGQEKEKDTRRAAEEAYKLAKEAAEISWKLYAEESIIVAGKAFAEAGETGAEFAAPESYEEARVSLERAERLFEESRYRESQSSAARAYFASQAAKNQALAKISELNVEISDVRNDIKRVEALSPGAEASGMLKSAGAELDSAGGMLDSGNISGAAAAIGSAKEMVSAARNRIAMDNLTERINKLQSQLDSLRRQDIPQAAMNDLRTAERSLKEARDRIQNTEEASMSADRAETAINRIGKIIMAEAAAERLASAKSLYRKLSEKDKEAGNMFADDLSRADQEIKAGDSLLRSEEYAGSIERSARAEVILNEISIALDRELERIAQIAAKEEPKPDVKTYIVQYRKVNTDCLWRIALFIYGDARLWPLIYMENRHQIKDPDLIFPGQEFVIPPIPEKDTQ